MRLALFAWFAALLAGCDQGEYDGHFVDFATIDILVTPYELSVEAIPEGDGADLKPPCPILTEARITIEGIEVPAEKRGGFVKNSPSCETAVFRLDEGVPQVAGGRLRLIDGDWLLQCDMKQGLVPTLVSRMSTSELHPGDSVPIAFGANLEVASLFLRDANGEMLQLQAATTARLPDELVPGNYDLIFTGYRTSESCASVITVFTRPVGVLPITVVL